MRGKSIAKARPQKTEPYQIDVEKVRLLNRWVEEDRQRRREAERVKQLADFWMWVDDEIKTQDAQKPKKRKAKKKAPAKPRKPRRSAADKMIEQLRSTRRRLVVTE